MQKTILALFGAAAFGLLGASSALAAPANGAAVGQLSQQRVRGKSRARAIAVRR
jgi:hypothetical protein